MSLLLCPTRLIFFVSVYVWVHVEDSSTSGIFPSCSPSHYLRLNLELIALSRLAVHWTAGSLLSQSFQSQSYRHVPTSFLNEPSFSLSSQPGFRPCYRFPCSSQLAWFFCPFSTMQSVRVCPLLTQQTLQILQCSPSPAHGGPCPCPPPFLLPFFVFLCLVPFIKEYLHIP